jgi:hypothetical protein
MVRRLLGLLIVVCGCSSGNPPPTFSTLPPSTGPSPDEDAGPPPRPKTVFANGEAIEGNVAPPPITAGTLLAARTGSLVFASNPDYDLVDVVDIVAQKTIWQPHVGSGSEPGRLTEDPSGKVWVVLRRAGMVATLDPVKQTVTKRTVCPAPRGITTSQTDVWVACEGGELVQIPLDGSASHTISLERDLRDVIVLADGSLVVTRFRSAEVLTVATLSGVRGSLVATRSAPARDISFEPHVAWRTIAAPDGSLYELHQLHSTRVIQSQPPDALVDVPVVEVPYYGGPSVSNTPPTAISPSASTLVTGAITRIVGGKMMGPFSVVGALDIAVSRTGPIAVAASMLSDGAPGVIVFSPGFGGIEKVIPTNGIPVGVAYTSTGHLVMQMRDPSEIDVDGNSVRISISPSIHDTGFALFHRSTVTGLACMSCHPEGGEDGHTWFFQSTDPNVSFVRRRTQSIRGGVNATAPFHWAGDMSGLPQLAHEVYTNRMDGQLLTDQQIAVLARWLDWVPRLPAPSTLDAAAVARGQTAFTKAGCDGCHRGAHLTDNLNHDVGTNGSYQTPSLVSVGARAPFMHDGCAPTLMVRLTDTTCGGDIHGNPAALSNGERADLVAYLEAL